MTPARSLAFSPVPPRTRTRTRGTSGAPAGTGPRSLRDRALAEAKAPADARHQGRGVCRGRPIGGNARVDATRERARPGTGGTPGGGAPTVHTQALATTRVRRASSPARSRRVRSIWFLSMSVGSGSTLRSATRARRRHSPALTHTLAVSPLQATCGQRNRHADHSPGITRPAELLREPCSPIAGVRMRSRLGHPDQSALL